MRYTIENSRLVAAIDAYGAELKSLKNKDTGFEYMWQGDPVFWGRTSPILFPFVGGLKDKKYTWKGVEYPMGQHGFARDMDFDLVSLTDTEIWFSLKDTEETREKYPFAFLLKIGYLLTDEGLQVSWIVENPSGETLHFSIGAHPAFNCPIAGEETKEGYRLRFDAEKEIHHYGNQNAAGLAVPDEDLVLTLQNHEVVITKEFFDRCTYIIDRKQVSELGIADPAGKCYVAVRFDMPLVAVWSPEGKNAPFICLEPWCGRCDAIDFKGDLSERTHSNALPAGETFRTGYTILV